MTVARLAVSVNPLGVLPAGSTSGQLPPEGTATINHLAQHGVTSSLSATNWAEMVVNLLKCASRAIPRSETHARSCITRATDLILSTANGADRRPGSATCQPGQNRLTQWQINRVIEYIETHLTKTIRMSVLAARTGLSTSYFFYAFRSTVGESPYKYVVRRRVGCAQSQMLVTDNPLSGIALDCGFSDQAHLTRSFKQLVGVTPAAWRRAHRAHPTLGAFKDRPIEQVRP